MDEFRVPDVMEYVMVKASQQDLQKKLKGWIRKVEITSMQTNRYFTFTRMRQMWHRMCIEAEQEKKQGSEQGKTGHLPDLMLQVG